MGYLLKGALIEYGSDFWCEIFEAGFSEVSLTSLIFPASVAIHAIKPEG
jgi:hypothetical protein